MNLHRKPLLLTLHFVFGITLFLLLSGSMVAQRTTGSIAITSTDPQGAVVPDALITVKNPARGFVTTAKTSGNGTAQIDDLQPAEYTVTIQAKNFALFNATVPVRVGVSTPVNAKLQLGSTETQVTVSETAATVDTRNPTVQGVITADRIQEIPLNGRNFLALAALEPGVQIVDGGNFDPTKNQFAGVSIGGRSGRVTRIQMDGVDITDETVGTTVTNISNESIREFQVAQSTLDPSTDITSAGAVNIVTRSGTNAIHGSGFGFFRDARFAADQRLDKQNLPRPSRRLIASSSAVARAAPSSRTSSSGKWNTSKPTRIHNALPIFPNSRSSPDRFRLRWMRS
jgi:hypothetical protein